MIQVGRYQISSIVTGELRLDGGAMFGVVPKVLWQNLNDVDDSNRILLATRSLLAVDRTSHRVLLVDTGCGSKWKAADAERYGIRPDAAAIDRALAAHGLQRGDVTDVVVTHLHFDHNGGLSNWFDDPGGRTVLNFPRAAHWIHEKQWDHTHKPTPKDRASYLKEDFAALEENQLLRLVTGDAPPPLMPGVEWRLSHGHTPYQLLVNVGEGREKVAFTGDAIPTSAHLRAGWVMAYDLYPLTTMEEKQSLARRAIEDGWLVAFPHDPKLAAVDLGGTPERPIISRTVTLSGTDAGAFHTQA